MLDKFFTYFEYVIIASLLLSIVLILVGLSIVFPPVICLILLALIGGAVLYYVEEVKDERT